MIDRSRSSPPFYADLETDSFDRSLVRLVRHHHLSEGNSTPVPKRTFSTVTLPRVSKRLRAYYHRVLHQDPHLRDLVIVLERVKDTTILASEREEFLRFVKREVVDGLWDRPGFLQGAHSRCMDLFGEGYVWTVPRVFFDVEALVEGGGEGMRETDMMGVTGRCKGALEEKWKACMFVKERGEFLPRA